MKFSLIIPVYNVDKYIRKCINSIVSQTCRDFEIVCINDGSTDNSLLILQEYERKYSNFILINQENKGQGVARNIGIKKSKGEYLCFIDPDDFVSEYYIEYLNKICNKTNANVIQFNFKTIDKNGVKYNNKSEVIERFSSIELNKLKAYSIKDLDKGNILLMGNTSWQGVYKKHL